ncbi:MAG: glycosyl transferase family 1 [Chloroflexi bacterium RBG_13_56_8]|nr:MAG: glycosyl transferase family 1 [Chloroflexi bacterium RBG_13_56_8]
MKVALLTQVLPYPPDSGPKVKTWNVLKYLAGRHQVTLFSFVRGDQSADIAKLQPFCQAIHVVPMERSAARDGLAMARSLLRGQPWMMMRDDRSVMRRLVDRFSVETSFDVAHADQLNMAQYAQRVPNARKVLDAHNALWLLYKRLAETMRPGPRKWLLERDWRLLKRYEGNLVSSFDAVLAVSDEDKAALLEAAGSQRDIAVIPIAVDVDEVRVVIRQPDAKHILHLGTMYWPPNIDGMMWFLREIFPLVRQARPDAVLDIVGSRPPEELQALSSPESGINVAGYVRDPMPYLKQTGVFIVPLRAGGGMRVKILNALAQGLPVVSTTLGIEGISTVPGQHLLVADTPRDFADAILRILGNPALAERLGSAGRRLIEQVYDYRIACRPLDEIYRA